MFIRENTTRVTADLRYPVSTHLARTSSQRGLTRRSKFILTPYV